MHREAVKEFRCRCGMVFRSGNTLVNHSKVCQGQRAATEGMRRCKKCRKEISKSNIARHRRAYTAGEDGVRGDVRRQVSPQEPWLVRGGGSVHHADRWNPLPMWQDIWEHVWEGRDGGACFRGGKRPRMMILWVGERWVDGSSESPSKETGPLRRRWRDYGGNKAKLTCIGGRSANEVCPIRSLLRGLEECYPESVVKILKRAEEEVGELCGILPAPGEKQTFLLSGGGHLKSMEVRHKSFIQVIVSDLEQWIILTRRWWENMTKTFKMSTAMAIIFHWPSASYIMCLWISCFNCCMAGSLFRNFSSSSWILMSLVEKWEQLLLSFLHS